MTRSWLVRRFFVHVLFEFCPLCDNTNLLQRSHIGTKSLMYHHAHIMFAYKPFAMPIQYSRSIACLVVYDNKISHFLPQSFTSTALHIVPSLRKRWLALSSHDSFPTSADILITLDQFYTAHEILPIFESSCLFVSNSFKPVHIFWTTSLQRSL